MVDWKLYIDSPLERSLVLCHGSLTEGSGIGGGYLYCGDDGCGWGYGYGTSNGWGRGCGYDFGYGTSRDNGLADCEDYGDCHGAGRSETEW